MIAHQRRGAFSVYHTPGGYVQVDCLATVSLGAPDALSCECTALWRSGGVVAAHGLLLFQSHIVAVGIAGGDAGRPPASVWVAPERPLREASMGVQLNPIYLVVAVAAWLLVYHLTYRFALILRDPALVCWGVGPFGMTTISLRKPR